MNLESLTVGIRYNIKENTYEPFGNTTEEGREEIITDFLRTQIGRGKDERKPQTHEIYTVKLEWFPEEDRIESYSNTGNNSLRDGILLRYLQQKE